MSIYIPNLGRNVPLPRFTEIAIHDYTSNKLKRTFQGNLKKKTKHLDIILNTNVKKTNELYVLKTECLL